jgi:thiol-disulfide isomerase/thioredoxin
MARLQLGRSGWIGVGAALVAIFAVAVFAGVSFSSSSTIQTLRDGSPAPAWSGRSLTGAQLSSTADRGRWVVLNFFATWCDACRQETPAIEAFVAAHPSGEVRVVSVLHADTDVDARRFVAAHHVTWPVVSAGASADAIAAHFQLADALPQTDVIAPDGRLAVQLAGAVTEAQLDRIISRPVS